MPLHPAPRYNCERGSQRLVRALVRGFTDSRRREVISEMVKVSVEVCSEGAHFDVAVRGESIDRAVYLVEGRYPGRDIKVKFPINPEGFFVKDPAARSGIVGFDRSDEMAA